MNDIELDKDGKVIRDDRQHREDCRWHWAVEAGETPSEQCRCFDNDPTIGQIIDKFENLFSDIDGAETADNSGPIKILYITDVQWNVIRPALEQASRVETLRQYLARETGKCDQHCCQVYIDQIQNILDGKPEDAEREAEA